MSSSPRRATNDDVLPQPRIVRVHPPVSVRLRDLHQELGVSPSKAAQLVADGRIPSVLIDGCRLIRCAAIEAFLIAEEAAQRAAALPRGYREFGEEEEAG